MCVRMWSAGYNTISMSVQMSDYEQRSTAIRHILHVDHFRDSQ